MGNIPKGQIGKIDENEANRVIEFAERLTQFQGRWANSKLKLMPWQKEFIRELFGRKVGGKRVYRTAYVEIPRKNGKSTLAAALALYLLLFDGEAGGQIYIAAYTREQASLIFDIAAGLASASGLSPKLVEIIPYRKRIVDFSTSSYLTAIPSDAAAAMGFNASGIIFDEFHTQKDRTLFDALTTSTGSREQPLTILITTAGYDRQSICYEQREYAEAVLEGRIDDSSFLPVIFAKDDNGDWTDPEQWAKANPSLGTTVTIDFLEREYKKALETPSYQNTFRRLYLDEWTSQETRWLDMEKWDAIDTPLDFAELEGAKCYAGLDLATSIDIAAFVMVFPIGDTFQVLPFFWIPEENMRDRELKDRVPYERWVRQGYMTATPGNVINYDMIREDIKRLATKYDIREVAFDRWGATQITQELEAEGFCMVRFGQGFSSMSQPTKELQRLTLDRKLIHGNNPVMRWMADNLIVSQDPTGRIKPNRAKSREKIDGIVALVMALDRAMRHEYQAHSIYEDRGLVIV